MLDAWEGPLTVLQMHIREAKELPRVSGVNNPVADVE